MSEKSPDAYRTISEAGEEAGLPPHVLRFWESKFAQLKPVKRAGGRRMRGAAARRELGSRRVALPLLCGLVAREQIVGYC